MKQTIPFLAAALLTAGLLSVPTSAQAQVSPLVESMEKVDDAFKAFRRETDPARGAALAREGQDAVIAGSRLLPDSVTKIADAEAREKAAAAYRKIMARLLLTLCEIEGAFLANDLEEVAKQVDAVRALKQEGHDEFMED